MKNIWYIAYRKRGSFFSVCSTSVADLALSCCFTLKRLKIGIFTAPYWARLPLWVTDCMPRVKGGGGFKGMILFTSEKNSNAVVRLLSFMRHLLRFGSWLSFAFVLNFTALLNIRHYAISGKFTQLCFLILYEVAGAWFSLCSMWKNYLKKTPNFFLYKQNKDEHSVT